MMKRVNKLAIELPRPEHGDANGAAAVQELMGGKFGEMSTLNNYMFQSFNFRGKKKFKPFYDLIASITAEEFGHVELVANAINLMSYGNTFPGDLILPRSKMEKMTAIHCIIQPLHKRLSWRRDGSALERHIRK